MELAIEKINEGMTELAEEMEKQNKKAKTE